MERNLRLVLAYEGTSFHGWQTQPGLRTVQGELEQILRYVLRHPVQTQGASRTDAGVHALGQVVSFRTTSTIPAGNLRQAIGHRLPLDVTLRDLREVSTRFRASQDAVSKLYRYRIHNDRARPADPIIMRSAYHVWHELDLARTRAAAHRLIGTHDFAGFATKGAPRATTVRTILNFDAHRHYREFRIDVEGTGFLYNQVRNMVGTLIEIGRAHWEVDRIDEILASRDRGRAGPTAPAHGLCLQWIRYHPEQLAPDDETTEGARAAGAAVDSPVSADAPP